MCFQGCIYVYGDDIPISGHTGKSRDWTRQASWEYLTCRITNGPDLGIAIENLKHGRLVMTESP